MTVSITRTQNDTGPDLVLQATDSTTGNVIDLTGATMVMKWRAKGTTTLLTTTGMTVTPSATPTNGQFTVVWGATALAQAVGWYEGEVEITVGGKLISPGDLVNVYIRADF